MDPKSIGPFQIQNTAVRNSIFHTGKQTRGSEEGSDVNSTGETNVPQLLVCFLASGA